MHRFETWRDKLLVAPTAKAVIGLMHEYVAAINPAVIEALGRECQASLTDPIDVQAAAVALVQCELIHEGSPEMLSLLHEMAHTFAVAAVRITALHGKPSGP